MLRRLFFSLTLMIAPMMASAEKVGQSILNPQYMAPNINQPDLFAPAGALLNLKVNPDIIKSGSFRSMRYNSGDLRYYWHSTTQQVWEDGKSIQYPHEITEASGDTKNSADFAYTEINPISKKAVVRTNCVNKPNWSSLTQRSTQEFNCVTADEEFCKRFKNVEQALQAESFKSTADNLAKCSATIAYLETDSAALADYVNGKSYREISNKNSNALFGLRNSKNVNIGLEDPQGYLNKVDLKIFNANDLNGLSNVNAVAKSMDKLRAAAMACNALEEATIMANNNFGARSAIGERTQKPKLQK